MNLPPRMTDPSDPDATSRDLTGRISAVPAAFDALRPATTVGAAFYTVFGALVYWIYRDEVTILVPAAVGLLALTFLGVRLALATRWRQAVEQRALVVVAILAFAASAVPILFMVIWQRPYPGIGLIVIMLGISAIIHHHGVAALLILWCNTGWIWAASTYGVPVHWSLFVTEVVMVNVGASIVHLAGTRTVRRLELARRDIAALAATDDLTGAANARHVYEVGQERLDSLADGEGLAVIYLDLDDLKARNDAHGHLAGDQALRDFADTLRTVVRPGDIVGRIGGDEFVILAAGLDEPDTESLTSRLRTLLDEQCLPASIGYVVAEAGRDDFQALLNEADRRMYAVKQQRASRRLR